MPHSHHSHSGQFCKHAQGTLEDVVLEAIHQGFEVFGLTEHVPRYRAEDLYPEEKDITPSALEAQFAAFLDEAHRLKEKYRTQITLLVGLETEHITPQDLVRLDELLSRETRRIQYVVGSVHHVQGIPIDFDKATWETALAAFPGADAHAQTEAFLSAYFDAQLAVLQRVQPEVVAHADLCRLYVPGLRFAEYPGALSRLRRNVAFAVGYGALFELNAAALRKGWDDAYPGEDVVRVIQEIGGRFALSDDSHGPHAVGLNYARLREYARRVEIDDLYVLEEAEEANVAGRFVQARRVEEKWWEHGFWEDK